MGKDVVNHKMIRSLANLILTDVVFEFDESIMIEWLFHSNRF